MLLEVAKWLSGRHRPHSHGTSSPDRPDAYSHAGTRQSSRTAAMEFDGNPCDPYVIERVGLWFWENTVRWTPDGSAVFFSQCPVVLGAAINSAWARTVADASAWISPRLPWHSRVRRDVVVGPMTYFEISPAGASLVYAT